MVFYGPRSMLTRAATLKFPLRLLQPPKASSCTPRCSDSNELKQCSAIEANNQVLEKEKKKKGEELTRHRKHNKKRDRRCK